MKGYIYVTNFRSGDVEQGETAVRIDRASVLGNPERLLKKGDMQERMRVLAMHEQYVNEDLKINGPISQALNDLAQRVNAGEKIALQCWCAPLPCHGDHLAKVIMRIAKQIEKIIEDAQENAPAIKKFSFTRPTH